MGLSHPGRHGEAEVGQPGAELFGPGDDRLPAPVFGLGDAGRLQRRAQRGRERPRP